MKLSKIFRTKDGVQDQMLDLNCIASNDSQIESLGYEDFKADLYIDGKYIGNIAPVLLRQGSLFQMVDDTDWYQILAETKVEQREQREIERNEAKREAAI